MADSVFAISDPPSDIYAPQSPHGMNMTARPPFGSAPSICHEALRSAESPNTAAESEKPLKKAKSRKPLVALLDGKDCKLEMDYLREHCLMAFCNAPDRTEIHSRVFSEAFGIFVWDTFHVDRRLLLMFAKLKVIVCIGYDTSLIDIEAATSLGIAVSHVPSIGIDEAADTTLCQILSLYRRTFWLATAMKNGQRYRSYEDVRSSASGSARVAGSSLGIVGLGRVGKAVAYRAKACGMKVLFYDPHLPAGAEVGLPFTRLSSLGELLRNSRCVSLHCPLTQETMKIINSDTLALMPRGSFLVNTAKGGLVDEAALLAALRSKHLMGAALDVFEKEPFNIEASILIDAPNLICTPHVAWLSDESEFEARKMAAEEMKRAVNGRKNVPDCLRFCINKRQLNTGQFGGAPAVPSPITPICVDTAFDHAAFPTPMASPDAVAHLAASLMGGGEAPMAHPYLMQNLEPQAVPDQAALLTQMALAAQTLGTQMAAQINPALAPLNFRNPFCFPHFQFPAGFALPPMAGQVGSGPPKKKRKPSKAPEDVHPIVIEITGDN